MLAIMGRFGRLGNQLWTYANVLAYALDKRINCVNAAFEAQKAFVGSCGVEVASCRPPGVVVAEGWAVRNLARLAYKVNLRTGQYPFIQIGESNLLNFDVISNYTQIFLRHRFVFLSGLYFYAPASLEKKKDCIRQFFTLTRQLNSQVSALITNARKDCDVLVGIHMRQRDYRTFCDGVMYYSSKEYADVMRSIVEQLSHHKISFLLCSDEKQDLAFFKGLDVHQSGCEPIIDMYALSHCDYIIGPNSTFNQWASFFGDVPLHTLDWKVGEKYGKTVPIKRPELKTNFAIFSPQMFGRYSNKQVFLDEVMSPWL